MSLPERPTAKAQKTRQRIRESAFSLFAERGFDATSMRDIAERAELSVGSTYYHFRTKDDLVLAYYTETQDAAEERALTMADITTSFEERLRDIIAFRLDLMSEARSLVLVLARNTVDPDSRLSPFHPATASLRERSLAMMEEAVEGSDLKVDPILRTKLPMLLWLYQLGIVFFWQLDRSPGFEKTRVMLDQSLTVLTTALKLTAHRLPLAKGMSRDLVDIVGLLEHHFAPISGAEEASE